MLELSEPAANHTIYVARVTGPEMVAAFFGKVRTEEVTESDAISASENFQQDFYGQYHIVEITDIVAELAMELTRRHPLRGYDAVQLASALHLATDEGLSSLTFISADRRLNNAAALESLIVDDPNDH